MLDRFDILRGIDRELADTARFIDFHVTRSERQGDAWSVFVDLDRSRRGGLDESLEGSAAWWPGPPNGTADVLSVVPEKEQINLRFATARPPGAGGMIRLYPPRYLEALRDVWDNAEWAAQCIRWLEKLHAQNSPDPELCPSSTAFAWLRRGQARSFELPGWHAGFLWGPPGTGKTTTLGAMLAQYLVQFPGKRVLLLSTTNTAVDQALVAVDRALVGLGSREARIARNACKRVGSHFIAAHYTGREHLLPATDPALIRKLAALEAQVPDKEDVQAYARWKLAVEQVRELIRKQAKDLLKEARLAALTTTRAAFTHRDLRDLAPYDLVVFDEASQVGIAHALALAPLGRRVVFAGDPQQLAPIVQSDHPMAQAWLGRSMFHYKDACPRATYFLDEQSRMAAPICRIVSDLFYDGRLRLAAGCDDDPLWRRERRIPQPPAIGSERITLEATGAEGKWSRRYHGPIRYETATIIADWTAELLKQGDLDQLIILTPFRAQRTLIKGLLRNKGIRGVTVSTVHRAQGSERHTVIFDPAQGDNDFLKTEDARRLVNVALSRAKARLMLTLSPGDRQNPLFGELAYVLENRDLRRAAESIGPYARGPGFPASCVGKVVRIGRYIGTVTRVVDGGAKFEFVDVATGQTRTFSTAHVVKKYAAAAGRPSAKA